MSKSELMKIHKLRVQMFCQSFSNAFKFKLNLFFAVKKKKLKSIRIITIVYHSFVEILRLFMWLFKTRFKIVLNGIPKIVLLLE